MLDIVLRGVFWTCQYTNTITNANSEWQLLTTWWDGGVFKALSVCDEVSYCDPEPGVEKSGSDWLDDLIDNFQMSDTSYPTMTQQHFSTDPMLTNTIENRQFGTMGRI